MKGSVWHGCQLKNVCFHNLNSQNKTKCSEGASVIFVNLLFGRFQNQLWRDCFVRDLGFYTVRGRHELVKLIIEKIYVHDQEVKIVTLRLNYHLVLEHKINGSTYQEVDPFLYQSGSDGHRHLVGCSTVILATNANHPAILRYLLGISKNTTANFLRMN